MLFPLLAFISRRESAINGARYCSQMTLAFDIFEMTKVSLPKSTWKTGYSDKVGFLGSCFSDNMAEKLTEIKFNVLSNPFGTIYSPNSILNTINMIVSNKVYTSKDLFECQLEKGLYHSWDHHSSYSGRNINKVIEKINYTIHQANQFLSSTRVIFLTFGTTQIHSLKENNRIVANCHKQPSSLFNKRLLSTQECVDTISKTIQTLKFLNSNIKVVLTVSPVRHTRMGITENSLSKSTLICAVHEAVSKYPEDVLYFPSYEIVLDELRDYRWYAEDLIHPSPVTVNYLFGKFQECFFTEDTRVTCEEISKVLKDANHRPIIQSHAYVTHLSKTLVKLEAMQHKYPLVDFSSEVNRVNDLLRLIEFDKF